ncbi:MAG: corrinoid protein [Planctomycetia bacterium]|nr:corrinoid protein [Planctomycetia bacterium]
MSEPNPNIFNAILTGKNVDAKKFVQDALDAGENPHEIITNSMITAMDEAGKRFEEHKFFVPQLMIAARAMKESLAILSPLLAASGAEPIGTVVIGTVMGDMHDIGKNLVASMLEGAGFRVVDLGVNVAPDKFLKALQENNAEILCMSALLTTTMPAMKKTIEALDAAEMRNSIQVMIGGAPVTQAYADEIGADGYSDNANSAVVLARKLISRA